MTMRGVALLILFGIIGAGLFYLAPIPGLVVLGVVVVAGIALVKSGASLTGLSGRLTIAVPALAAAGFGWLATKLAVGLAGDRTPAPPAAVGCPLDTARRSAVLAYARTLHFAEYSDSSDVYPTDSLGIHETRAGEYNDHEGKYHGQYDKNLVDTFGDVVVLEPEVNIHRTRTSDLRCGRIQLRMRLRVGQKGRDPTQIYDSLRTPPGVSYLWVDSFELANRESGSARAVIFPVDPSLPVRIEKVQVNRSGLWNKAVARWTPGKCYDCGQPYWCSNP